MPKSKAPAPPRLVSSDAAGDDLIDRIDKISLTLSEHEQIFYMFQAISRAADEIATNGEDKHALDGVWGGLEVVAGRVAEETAHIRDRVNKLAHVGGAR